MPHATTSSSMKAGVLLAGVALSLFTCLFRILALVGFENDHFLYLAPAQQMLAGEWPSRDFVDPGTPLMYAVSAAARLAVGPPLLAEALLVSTAFGLAAGLTTYAAFVASRSLWIAVPLTIAHIAVWPRTYHYPKLLLLAVGVVAMWAYVRDPRWQRRAALAMCVVVAFLFRHDLGVYLGVAALIAAAMTGRSIEDAGRAMALLAGLVVLAALPYLIYVETTSGLAAHLAGGIAYSRAEIERTMLGLPIINPFELAAPENARVALYYVYHLLPAWTMILIGSGWWRGAEWARSDGPMLIPVAALSAMANVAFLRDPLAQRLADPVVPACILAAWLARRAYRARGWMRLVGCAAGAVIATVAAAGVNAVGNVADQIDRAGFMLSGDRLLEHLGDRLAQLQAPLAEGQFPSRVIAALVPFFGYVGRCTTPDQRLFVAGNAPEVYVYARRLFAGGQPALRGGYFSTTLDQHRLIARLRQQDVPVALVLTDSDADEMDLVMAEVQSAFRFVQAVPVGGGNILIHVNRRATATGTDAVTGLPCFR
jgi:hypothetical protein